MLRNWRRFYKIYFIIRINFFNYIFYNINKDHSIIVEFEIKKFDLKFNITGKGNAEIDSGTKEIVYGDNKTIKIKPESGWEVYKVFVNGQLKDVVGNKFNITNIKSNLDVQIIFKEVEKPWFTSPIALIMISLIVLGITIPIIIKLRKVFNNKVEVDNEDLT